MRLNRLIGLLALWGTSSAAEEPLSAIDWLNETAASVFTQPLILDPNQPAVANTVEVPAIQMTEIDGARTDAAGLLSHQTTGLPLSLWRNSSTEVLLEQFRQVSVQALPAIISLHYMLLLAEADPPSDAGQDGRFISARVAALKRLGATEPALALVNQAGGANRFLFDQWFELALLLGQEDDPCAQLTRKPGITEDMTTRIYCVAKSGDWPTAALTLRSAAVLGRLSETDTALLALFLDPEMIEDHLPPEIPAQLTALQFRLFEAIGMPISTQNLPLHFAFADLRGNSGWKAEIEAAERLAAISATPPQKLFGLYTDRAPAASGGVWDRVAAIQALDKALVENDRAAVAATLSNAWRLMKARGLSVAFAEFFATRLAAFDLPPDTRSIALHMALLSPDFEDVAQRSDPQSDQDRFIIGVALGKPDPALARNPMEEAVAKGFAAESAAETHRPLLASGQLGQAILMAAAEFDPAAAQSGSRLADAIATLRSVGLESTARRAALQLLLLADEK